MPWHPAMDVMWFMVPMVKYRFLPLFFVFQKHRFGFDPFLNNPKPGHGNEWALFYEWEPSSQSENRAVKEIENDLSLSSSLLTLLCHQVSWVIYGSGFSSLNYSGDISSEDLNLETKFCFLFFLVPSWHCLLFLCMFAPRTLLPIIFHLQDNIKHWKLKQCILKLVNKILVLLWVVFNNHKNFMNVVKLVCHYIK